jgi:hypothetical protein
MEAIRSSETSGTTQRTTRRHIPEEDTLQFLFCPFNNLDLLTAGHFRSPFVDDMTNLIVCVSTRRVLHNTVILMFQKILVHFLELICFLM